jgi:hypothetical protein
MAVVAPAAGPRVAPRPLGDAGQARQQQKAQVIEVGNRLGPDRGLDPRDLRGPAGPSASAGSQSNDSATVMGEYSRRPTRPCRSACAGSAGGSA